MLPENLPPVSPVPVPTSVVPLPSRGGKGLLILTVLLGVGMLLFAILTVVAFGSSSRSKAATDSANQKSYARGQADQKKTDEEHYRQLSSSPFRSYIAPDIYGAFEIKFPKDWNGSVIEDAAGQQQINMTLNPDFIKQVQGTDNIYGLHVVLMRTTYGELTNQRKDEVKAGRLKLSSITVSGISSSRYDGKYDGKHDGLTVLVPVRDKTIMISTDDKKYSEQFNQILAQSHILP